MEIDVNEIMIYAFILIFSGFLAACSQILLKKSADRNYNRTIEMFLNLRNIMAYALFCISAMMGMYVLRFMPLSLTIALQSLVYIFVAGLSHVFLHERIKRRQVIGIAMILAGVFIFSV